MNGSKYTTRKCGVRWRRGQKSSEIVWMGSLLFGSNFSVLHPFAGRINQCGTLEAEPSGTKYLKNRRVKATEPQLYLFFVSIFYCLLTFWGFAVALHSWWKCWAMIDAQNVHIHTPHLRFCSHPINIYIFRHSLTWDISRLVDVDVVAVLSPPNNPGLRAAGGREKAPSWGAYWPTKYCDLFNIKRCSAARVQPA